MEEQSKYHPLTDGEWTELIETLRIVNDYLPDNKAPFIWDLFNRTRGVNEPRPCTCASSGAHWGRAINHLREFVKERK
jgi:hypothetical protein